MYPLQKCFYKDVCLYAFQPQIESGYILAVSSLQSWKMHFDLKCSFIQSLVKLMRDKKEWIAFQFMFIWEAMLNLISLPFSMFKWLKNELIFKSSFVWDWFVFGFECVLCLMEITHNTIVDLHSGKCTFKQVLFNVLVEFEQRVIQIAEYFGEDSYFTKTVDFMQLMFVIGYAKNLVHVQQHRCRENNQSAVPSFAMQDIISTDI